MLWIVGGVVVAIVVVLAVLVVREMRRQAIPPPSFPSLQQSPDSSLHGTVAYLAGSQKFAGAVDKSGTGSKSGLPTWCVRVVAAAGSPAKNAVCITSQELEGMVGPQLRWRSDGRLEVTMFRSSGKSGTAPVGPGWQKLVDVRTGAVQDVAAANVPAAPTHADTRVAPKGERVAITNSNGHVEVLLKTSAGSRPLLSAKGNPSYGMTVAGWSSDGKWLLVNDGRLLLVTVADPAETRVLVEDPAAYGDVDGAGITQTVAATSADVLGTGG